MHKEAYERLILDVTAFDAEDVITTSGITPGGGGGGSDEPGSTATPGSNVYEGFLPFG